MSTLKPCYRIGDDVKIRFLDSYWYWEYELPVAGGTVVRALKINAVHQLQNLFFALTGTELALK